MADFYLVVCEDEEGMFSSEPEFENDLFFAKRKASRMLDGCKPGHYVEIYECRHKWSARPIILDKST